MVDRELLKQNIVENINDNGRQKITGSKLQKQLLEMVDSMLDPEGRYPDMSVGFSDNLVGRGESTPAEFTFRATGGKSIKDGAARIKRIKGNSVVWNNVSAVVEGGNTALPQGARLIRGHKYLIIANRLDGYGVYVFTRKDSMNIEVSGALQKDNGIRFFTSEYDAMSTGVAGQENSLWWYVEGNYGQANLHDLTQMFGAGNEPTTIEEFNARKPIVADEFAYNEGEVIHMNTESIKSVGDNAWDEEWEAGNINLFTGENEESIYKIRSKNYIKILPNTRYFFRKPAGAYVLPYYYDEDKQFIASDDVLYTSEEGNEFTTMNAAYMRFSCTYANYESQYNNDLMLTLVHSGWKQDTDAGYQPYCQDTLPLPIIRKYFPDGMKSAGSAHDEIRFNKASGKWEKVVRIAEVDMGSLTWGKEWYNEAEAYRIFTDITNKAAGLSNILCGAYTNANVGDGIMADFTITGNTSTNYVYLKDSSYSAEGVDALIDSLQGVMLYYELAEPVIREIDEPIGTDYRVADFGTEQAQSSVPSAPFSADIIYQFNAVDMIREHQIEIENLKSMVATMQTYLTSLVFQEK